MRALSWIGALLISAAAFGQKELVGTYEAVMYLKGSAVSNRSLPVGQVMLFKLNGNGTWQMHNMLSGWEGKWTLRKNRVEMITLVGTTGKMKKPHTDWLEISPNKKVLTLKKGEAKVMEFRRDDSFESKLAKRYQEVAKKTGIPWPPSKG
jgi:hypothetical protein